MFNFFKKKVETLEIATPFAGTVVPLEKVPDPVFSQKMVGDGFALIPKDEVLEVKAPVDGVLSMVFDTGHAFGVKMANDFEVLVHLGIDTVELGGQGFEILKKQGESVKQGDVVIRMDVPKLKELERDPITPVVFTNKEMTGKINLNLGDNQAIACSVELN